MADTWLDERRARLAKEDALKRSTWEPETVTPSQDDDVTTEDIADYLDDVSGGELENDCE